MAPFLKPFAAAAVMAALAGGAQADSSIGAFGSYDFGLLSSSKGVSVGDPVYGFSGAFDNTFSFTLGSFSTVTGAVTGIDVFGDLTARYRLGVGTTPTWSAWSAPAPVPSDPDTGVFGVSMGQSGLTSGQTYWFELSGAATQAAYSVTLAPSGAAQLTTAVPEAETWALLLSGLGLVGVVARRRGQKARQS